MKRVLSLFLIIILTLSLAPSVHVDAAANISKTSLTLTVGKTTTLKITGTTQHIKWTSSKKSVATVSKGKVTAKKAGSATITATVDGEKYICKVKVVDKKEEVNNISDVINYLDKNGFIKGKETKMDASLIGGKNGVKYSDSKIEVYEFDTKSDAYKILIKTGKVTIEGLNYDLTMSAVNGKFAIYCEDSANKDKIVKAFNCLSVK